MNHALNRVIFSDKFLAVSIDDAAKQCRLTSDELNNETIAELESCILVAQSYISQKYSIIFGNSKGEAIYTVENYNIKKLYLPAYPINSVETITINNEQRTDWEFQSGDYTSYVEFQTSLHPNKKVKIEYLCGYNDVSNIPTNIKHSILMLVAHYFDNKNPQSTQNHNNIGYAIDALMAQFNKIKVA